MRVVRGSWRHQFCCHLEPHGRPGVSDPLRKQPVFGVTPVRERGPIGMIAAIARDAQTGTHLHPFPPPYAGQGYVVESADGRTLGLYYVTAGTAVGQRYVGFSGRTLSTAEAERHGAFYSSSARGTDDLFIALVPTGGTLDSTYRGRTKRLAVRAGVATGVVPGGTVLAIHVGSSTLTHHLRPYGRCRQLRRHRRRHPLSLSREAVA